MQKNKHYIFLFLFSFVYSNVLLGKSDTTFYIIVNSVTQENIDKGLKKSSAVFGTALNLIQINSSNRTYEKLSDSTRYRIYYNIIFRNRHEAVIFSNKYIRKKEPNAWILPVWKENNVPKSIEKNLPQDRESKNEGAEHQLEMSYWLIFIIVISLTSIFTVCFIKKKIRKKREQKEKDKQDELSQQKETEERAREEKREKEKAELKKLLGKKSDWQEFEKVLQDNNIKTLYHFTDSTNIESIKQHGGLYSWRYCEENKIDIPYPGGNSKSRELDMKYNLQDFVRLSFCNDHPMRGRLQQEGRKLVLLQINVDVVYFDKTHFSDINAIDSNHTHGSSLQDFIRINFLATKRNYIKKEDVDFKKHQAEVLVKTWIPIEYITNINNFI